MRPIQIKKDKRVLRRILRLKKEAETSGEYRIARRLHAVALNMEGHTSGDISNILDVHRNNVRIWLQNWLKFDFEGILEGYRPGRTPNLSESDLETFEDIVESGPIAYGFDSGVWTSPMLAYVIEVEFGVAYSPRHVRRLLHDLGFSVQRPRRKLARADSKKQNRWKRYTFPDLKKSLVGRSRAPLRRRSYVPTRPDALPNLVTSRMPARNPDDGAAAHQESDRSGRHLLISLYIPLREGIQCRNISSVFGTTL